MMFLKLPLFLAAVMVFRGVDGACVEDNCYGAMYWNPAGAEECSAHFITTVIPPPTTSTVTITSGVGDATTISGPFVGASTIVPSQVIPTYIVRACYGDVEYRFESACSCIGAGPTTTTAPQPVATNTVIVPFGSVAGISSRPLITASPVNGNPPREPIVVGPGVEPACLAVGLGPVIVTVQVDEFFAMSLTVSGPVFCIAEPTPSSSQCNCASTLPSSAPFSSSSMLAIANETSSTSSDSFSTIFRTSYTPTSSGGFSNFSTAQSTATPEPSSTSEGPSETFEPSTSSHSFQPFETRNFNTSSTSTAEPSSTTAEPSSTTAEPSSTTAEPSSTTSEPSSTTAEPSPSSTSPPDDDSDEPGPFVPFGLEIILRISAGTYTGQYIETDEPDGTTTTNLRSRVTANVDAAAVWTLDAATGVLFQEIAGAWWGAYFAFGSRTQWSSVLLAPAEQVVPWIQEPVLQREPLRCSIDWSANMLVTCGSHGWTQLTQSDRCGWAVTTPLNNFHANACPGQAQIVLQGIWVSPRDEGISK